MIVHFGRIPIEETVMLYLIGDTKHPPKASPYAEQQRLARKLLSTPRLSGFCVAPLRDTTKLVVFGLKRHLDPPCPELEHLILDFNLSIESVQRPDHTFVEAAIKFTLFFWLEAEGYAKVGDALMPHDSLFAPPHEGMLQIAFNINVSPDYDVDVSFMARMVRVQVLEEWLFERCNSQLQERWVFVLPKLGRGRVVGAHRALPAHSPFATYGQLREYWSESYGYTLPPRDPDCYYDIKFNGMRHTFLYPYFLVWAQKPEPIHFMASMEHERNACKEFLVSLKNCCQGRVIGGFEVDVRLKAGEVNKITASVASLQQRRQLMVPKLGPFRPDAPFKRPIIVSPEEEDSSSEEDFLTSKLSSSRTNLVESIKPTFGYQKVSPAEMAKSLGKKRDFNASLTSDLEPLEKKKRGFLREFQHSNEKKTFAGPSFSLQVPQSATQLAKEQPANKEMKLKQVSFSKLAADASKSVEDPPQMPVKSSLSYKLKRSFEVAAKTSLDTSMATKDLGDRVDEPLLKKEQTFATSSPTGKTLRTPLLDLKNKTMPSQRVSQPRAEPKNEKTNFATPLMRKPGTSHASQVVIDVPNTQQRPPPDRSQLSQVNPSQPYRVVLSDGIYPIGSTPRRTPHRMPNIEF
ncbi:unnamed protein product, partial [Mesorhabditis belari]|uniref:DUF4708 domain-containing protein n=1 Tax=Mesorhabditis belari TaxID=2138241 RepID=A0AAF3J9G6_9BILA